MTVLKAMRSKLNNLLVLILLLCAMPARAQTIDSYLIQPNSFGCAPNCELPPDNIPPQRILLLEVVRPEFGIPIGLYTVVIAVNGETTGVPVQPIVYTPFYTFSVVVIDTTSFAPDCYDVIAELVAP